MLVTPDLQHLQQLTEYGCQWKSLTQGYLDSTGIFAALWSSFAPPFSPVKGGAYQARGCQSSPFPFTPVPLSQLGDFVFNSPLSRTFLDPTTRSSYTQSWNLTVEQQVASDVTVSVSYIGNHSSKIVSIIDLNPAIFGPGATRGNTNARRSHPGFSRLRWFSGFNDANYHGGRIEIEKRSLMGLSVFANYTHAKSIDLESSGTIGIVEVRQPINRAQNRGPSDFDQTHRANVSFLYELPRATSSGGAGSSA